MEIITIDIIYTLDLLSKKVIYLVICCILTFIQKYDKWTELDKELMYKYWIMIKI